MHEVLAFFNFVREQDYIHGGKENKFEQGLHSNGI